MSDLAPGIQSRRDTIMGWIIFVAFSVLLYNIITMPRTPLEQRGPLIDFHFNLGFVIFVLVVIRLIFWLRGPRPTPPAGLPAESFAFNRAVLLAIFLVFAVEGIGGFLYAWGIGHPVSVLGIALPPLVEEGERMRMSQGYFHSALGFYYLMLFCIWLAFGGYQTLRYKVGIRRLFPGAQV